MVPIAAAVQQEHGEHNRWLRHAAHRRPVTWACAAAVASAWHCGHGPSKGRRQRDWFLFRRRIRL